MQIECKIKRAAGTDVELFGKTYKFRADSIERHVCEVKDKKAVGRLLAISEAYRIVTDDEDDFGYGSTESDTNPDTENTLQPSGSSLDGDIEISDDDIEGYVEPEPEDENENSLGPVNAPDDGRNATDEDEAVNEGAVRLEWEEVFGKKAGRRKLETLLEDLRAEDQE